MNLEIMDRVLQMELSTMHTLHCKRCKSERSYMFKTKYVCQDNGTY